MQAHNKVSLPNSEKFRLKILKKKTITMKLHVLLLLILLFCIASELTTLSVSDDFTSHSLERCDAETEFNSYGYIAGVLASAISLIFDTTLIFSVFFLHVKYEGRFNT